jgi:hypothetical protein
MFTRNWHTKAVRYEAGAQYKYTPLTEFKLNVSLIFHQTDVARASVLKVVTDAKRC